MKCAVGQFICKFVLTFELEYLAELLVDANGSKCVDLPHSDMMSMVTGVFKSVRLL